MFLLTLCAVYACAGISGFIAFLMLGNYVSSLWAAITGIISAISTHLRWLKYRNTLNQWYGVEELAPLAHMAFVFFTLGVMGVVYHTTVEILSKKPLLPVAQSEVISIVWSFMTAKCGMFLMYTARSFCKNGVNEVCTNRNNFRSI